MKQFIAYFDYLGFKQFIEKNDIEYQKHYLGNIFRDIESALANGLYKDGKPGAYMADLSISKLNCINFSDTVIFWTLDDSNESLEELLSVAFTFNWQAIDYFFPVRGVLVYDEIYHVTHSQKNGMGGSYNINSVIGHGLISAHVKANCQNWAGTVIDQSVIDEIRKRKIEPEKLFQLRAKKYSVPYKDGLTLEDEYVLCLVTGTLNDEAFKNCANGISENFANHKKSLEGPGVETKLQNTLQFLASFRQ
jgi:hypothetical protein